MTTTTIPTNALEPRKIILHEKISMFTIEEGLEQWFSTGVPWDPLVPWKALGVSPICKLDVYLLVNCIWGYRKIVLMPKRVPRNKKG